MSKKFGIIALIFGLIALVISIIIMQQVFTQAVVPLIAILGFVFAVIPIILGSVGIAKDDKRGLAIVGLIIGCITVVICIIILIVGQVIWLINPPY